MSDAKTQKRIDDLIARATHESTPAEEARTCAMLAVKMVAKHGAPKASHDYPSAAMPLALQQLRESLIEIQRLGGVVDRLNQLIVKRDAEIDGLKTEVMAAKGGGKKSPFVVDLGRARFVVDDLPGRSRPMTDGEQRAYLDELYCGIKT